MRLQVCTKTDIGLRRKNNEDRYFVDKKQGLFIVADGMGGHAGGEVASQLAVETVSLSLQIINQDNPQEQLNQAIEEANQAVAKEAKNNSALDGMGTTLSIILFHQHLGYLAHIGDSRIYRFNNRKLEQLSDDHSLVGEQLRQGILTREQAKTSTLGNILLQAIGITPQLDICQKSFPLTSGDLFLLCSDGLTDMVSDTKIEALLKQPDTLNTRCNALIEAAIAAGGKDNITVVLLQIDQLEQ